MREMTHGSLEVTSEGLGGGLVDTEPMAPPIHDAMDDDATDVELRREDLHALYRAVAEDVVAVRQRRAPAASAAPVRAVPRYPAPAPPRVVGTERLPALRAPVAPAPGSPSPVALEPLVHEVGPAPCDPLPQPTRGALASAPRAPAIVATALALVSLTVLFGLYLRRPSSGGGGHFPGEDASASPPSEPGSPPAP